MTNDKEVENDINKKYVFYPRILFYSMLSGEDSYKVCFTANASYTAANHLSKTCRGVLDLNFRGDHVAAQLFDYVYNDPDT